MSLPFFTVAWIPPTTIGFQPQHPTDGAQPFFTTAWHPRLGTTDLAYGPEAAQPVGGLDPDAAR